MDAIVRYFEMGGYAFYVWGAYGVTFALLAIEIAWLAWRRRQRIRHVTQRPPAQPQWRRST